MLRFVLAFLLVVSASGDPARGDDKVDRSHPVIVASDFLKAYAAGDALAMAERMTASLTPTLKDVAEKGQAARAYSRIFAGWQFDGARAWTGNFGEARTMTRAGHAEPAYLLPYFVSPKGWIGVLVLQKTDRGWVVSDFERARLEDYRAFPLADF